MPRTVLVSAAGARVGSHCASQFHAAGYNVITASRSLKDNLATKDHLQLHVDLAQPETISALLERVRDVFEHPRVVIHNGAAMTFVPPKDLLSTLSIVTIDHDTSVNVTSALIAAREAVIGWHEDVEILIPTFIYTGNKQDVMTDPKALTFGMAKTAAARMIWDYYTGYREKGYRFDFTDQHTADESLARNQMDPKARAELYVELAEDVNHRPWH